MVKIALNLIRTYRILSSALIQARLIPGLTLTNCKFHPSCSEYTEQSLKKYGFFKGTARSLKRIIKCNPLSPAGIDMP